MKRIINIFFLINLFVFFSCSYSPDVDLSNLITEAKENGISFNNHGTTVVVSPQNQTNRAMIFYPGGAVKYEAYLPLMIKCAEKGIKCFLLQMPNDLAILNITAAKCYIEDYPEITDWYLGGHSLGGAMAGNYIQENANDFKGLILLAAYTNCDISNTNLKVLSIYGENDQVMKRDKYNENKKNLPQGQGRVKEIKITGGNHGNFGCYGEQKGDGRASISAEEQQAKTARYIEEFMEENQ